MKFRKLKEDEIDVRVQSCTQKGCILLLYKDARCDMNILDEVVGAMNWERKHEEIKGNLYCTVSIWDKEKNMWIKKSDCGSESNTEAEKGHASDSFKRACFNWGIGRELYTSPFLWVKAEECNIKDKSFNGKTKYVCNDKFVVEKITYAPNGSIDGLSIKNITTNKRVFVQKPNTSKEVV